MCAFAKFVIPVAASIVGYYICKFNKAERNCTSTLASLCACRLTLRLSSTHTNEVWEKLLFISTSILPINVKFVHLMLTNARCTFLRGLPHLVHAFEVDLRRRCTFFAWIATFGARFRGVFATFVTLFCIFAAIGAPNRKLLTVFVTLFCIFSAFGAPRCDFSRVFVTLFCIFAAIGAPSNAIEIKDVKKRRQAEKKH